MNPTGKQIKAVLARLPKPFYDLDFIKELHEELKLPPTPVGWAIAREKLVKCVRIGMVKERIEKIESNHSIEGEDGKKNPIPRIVTVYEYLSN